MIKHKQLVFECEEDCVEKTQALLSSLETELGIRLHIDKVGDVAHGDLICVFYPPNRGRVFIRLYEEEEPPILTSTEYKWASAEVKSKAKLVAFRPEELHKVHTAHIKPHGLTKEKLDRIPNIIKSVLPSARCLGIRVQ